MADRVKGMPILKKSPLETSWPSLRRMPDRIKDYTGCQSDIGAVLTEGNHQHVSSRKEDNYR